jgi:flagellar export protein FliJ
MNIAALRTYALQLEEIARLETAALVTALQEDAECLASLDARAAADADWYLLQVRQGTTVDQASACLDAMDRLLVARKELEQAQTALQQRWEAKRDELLDAMRYRKKMDLLAARAAQEQRRRRERQDQQLLDERAWRRIPLRTGEKA